MSARDWPRLARYVRERREELGLTQEEVATRGGPSTATIRLIEGGVQDSYRPKSLRQLAEALDWTPGSVVAILYGREPAVLAGGPPEPRTDGGHDRLRAVPEPEPEPAGEPVQDTVAVSFDMVSQLVRPALIASARAIRAHAEAVLARNPAATGADIFPGEPDLAGYWDLTPSLPVAQKSTYAAIARFGRTAAKSGLPPPTGAIA